MLIQFICEDALTGRDGRLQTFLGPTTAAIMFAFSPLIWEVSIIKILVSLVPFEVYVMHITILFDFHSSMLMEQKFSLSTIFSVLWFYS
jgi:hypothetical protein